VRFFYVCADYKDNAVNNDTKTVNTTVNDKSSKFEFGKTFIFFP